MRAVTCEEFERFILNYPRALDRAVTRFMETPVVMFHDYSIGPWPISIVARHTFSEQDQNVPCGWRVLENS
jgi:hypothetical protein